jgi:uncharacterized protein
VEHRFVIGVQDVPEHAGAWDFAVPAAWLAKILEGAEVVPAGADGRLEVEVTKAGNELLVRGSVQVLLTGTCARCLRTTPVHVDASILVLYVPGPTVEIEHAEDEEEEPEVDEGPDVEHFQGDRLVLDDYVRDTILLEVPMNPRCETDCSLPERPQGVS